MTTFDELKATPRHLTRTVYLYVRQSSIRQVLKPTESTARQCALPQCAIALGWRDKQMVPIDCNQGQSGASAVDGAGFKQLVAEVELGHAGIVLDGGLAAGAQFNRFATLARATSSGCQ
jgi:hypothetical protein